jgi:dolichol-phosphate mannosyltransferase
MNDIELSVVIPVYNNADPLPQLVERLLAVVDRLPAPTEIIFVDDGSTDGSNAWLRERGARDPRIRLLSLTRNFGGRAALCAGFEAVHGKRTVCMDADLENLPEDIPALLAALDRGHDLACGVREQRGDARWSRRIPSALLNAMARRRLETTVRDLWCGMRAMDSRILEDLASEGEARRLLTPLLLERARSAVEVPIRHAPAARGSGHSFVGLAAVALDFWVATARKPFLAAAIFAAGAAGFGVLLCIAGVAAGRPLLAVSGVVVGVGGALALLVALVGDYAQRIYELGLGRPFYVRRDDGRVDPPEASAGQDARGQSRTESES